MHDLGNFKHTLAYMVTEVYIVHERYGIKNCNTKLINWQCIDFVHMF